MIYGPYDTSALRWRELVWLYLGNCALSAVLLSGYVLGVPFDLKGGEAAVFVLAIISQAGLLNLAPAFLSAWSILGWPWRRSARFLAGGFFALLQLGLVTDVITYRLFQRHFDRQVVEVLTTKGAGDSITVDTANITVAVILVLFFISISLAMALWLTPRLFRWRPGRGILILLLALLAERTLFAAMDLNDNSLMPIVKNTLPFYRPFTVRWLARQFGYVESKPFIMPNSTGVLQIPRHPLGLRPDPRKPNIVFIAIEGGRFDVPDEQTMPNFIALGQDSLRLMNNFSTGNETRFGVFGFVYGLAGNYWVLALEQQVAPPWFDLLADQGYEFKILSCTDMNFPGFRQTCFRKLKPFITDQWPDLPRVERDRAMTDNFTNYLAERQERGVTGPFFSFIFFDASHQPYVHPAEDEIHPGIPSGQLNYLKLALSPSDGLAVKNSYLNSQHYIDRQIGRIVAALKATGEYDHTIIAVVGDHGEEFGEMGHFGHGSSFNHYQTQTFGLLHLPGEKPQVITRLTSHADFVPSVLTWMGITNAPDDYTTGTPIQGPVARRWTLLSSWQDTAIFNGRSITVFQQDQTRYLDPDYRVLGKNDPRRASATETTEALNTVKMFLK